MLITPRQALFIKFYFDPESETFSCIADSAVKAGYPRNAANNIPQYNWFKEARKDLEMVIFQGMQNLKEYLVVDTKKKVVNEDGQSEIIRDMDMERIKFSATKHVTAQLFKPAPVPPELPGGSTYQQFNFNIKDGETVDPTQITEYFKNRYRSKI